MRKLTLIFILVLGICSYSEAEITFCGEELQALCQDCSVSSWSYSKAFENSVESYENPNHTPVSNEMILLVPTGTFIQKELSLLNEAMNELGEFHYGKLLRERVVRFDNNSGQWKSRIDVKLFFEIPVTGNDIKFNKPMWVTERSSIHELLGAFDSNRIDGTIALNNYQDKSFLSYTFVHELFHLVDGNPEIGDKVIDQFLDEYRAILAETEIHQDNVNLYQKRGLGCKTPKWHDQFFGFFTKTEKAVYDKTLDLLYPENPVVSPIAKNSYEYLFERLGYRHNLGTAIKVGFTQDPLILKQLSDVNRKKREHIEIFFSKDENKNLLRKEYIYNLRSEGLNDKGGTRPRGATGG